MHARSHAPVQVAEREAARKAERDELRRLKAEMDAEAAALKVRACEVRTCVPFAAAPS